MKENKESNFAVIVGRFQVVELTEQHEQIFDKLFDEYDHVLAMVCLSSIQGTKANPLDFASRQQMLNEKYPKLQIRYIKDVKSDKEWSYNLDLNIANYSKGFWVNKIDVYGSKLNFIDHYTGQYNTVEIPQISYTNPHHVLKSISSRIDKNQDFREGCFYVANNQYDNPVTTVDIAVCDDNKILLGRKQHEKEFRFIGGFTESHTESFEEDALRELREECGDIKVKNLEYHKSFKIDDWRYRGETRCIKTMFFLADYVSGTPIPDDDIFELQWLDIYGLWFEDIVPEHHDLFGYLLDYYEIDGNPEK